MPAPPSDFNPSEPFAFLPGAGGAGRLFHRPEAILVADRPEEVRSRLQEARALANAGLTLVGGLAYEAAPAFEPRLARAVRAAGAPLLWLAAFARAHPVRLEDLPGADRGATFGRPTPRLDRSEHAAAHARVKAAIAAGDIYQANLAFLADVAVRGHPVALFRRLFDASPAPYASLVHTGRQWWLSLSPELFFEARDGRLRARPMKGTARRHPDPARDRAIAIALEKDPKNRAENLMITDLMRNDLARVARAGSVRVPALCTLETYAYVHQLTSTVEADLAPGCDAFDTLQALFPCGSITGAPKIRAQEILAETESAPRGLYCGAIGSIGPGARTALFNVAIRTLTIDARAPHRAALGLGSGIVADSKAEEEWAECLAKAGFLGVERPRTLVETMRRLENGEIANLSMHLARLRRSAAHFSFLLHEDRILRGLDALPRPDGPERLRLLVSREGDFALQRSAAPLAPAGPVDVKLAPLPVAADDWRLSHKTGDRAFYDEARRRARSFEVIFVRPDGQVTEGSFTNVFVARADGRLATPPGPGLLPGILRQALLESREAVEEPIAAEAVERAAREGGLFLGNALRGLMPAILA